MIRLVRLFTGADGQSHFEEGNAPIVPPGLAVDRSRKAPATTIYFEESAAGSSLDWHNDPHRRYVITLTGTVEFETRVGQTFTLFPGDILLAEDETGGGHRWRLVGDRPWCRVYVDIPDEDSGAAMT